MRSYIIFFIALVSSYYACTISLAPKSAQGSVGDNIDFKITVKHIHLPCLLVINATDFKYDKVTLLKETEWDTINPITFEKTITVRLDQAGKGEISVSRTCPIRTSDAKVNIDIAGISRKTDLNAVLSETKKWLVAMSKGDSASLGQLKSLREWLSGNAETYLPKKNAKETQKNLSKFLTRLDKVLALADSLKQTTIEATKSEIFR